MMMAMIALLLVMLVIPTMMLVATVRVVIPSTVSLRKNPKCGVGVVVRSAVNACLHVVGAAEASVMALEGAGIDVIRGLGNLMTTNVVMRTP